MNSRMTRALLLLVTVAACDTRTGTPVGTAADPLAGVSMSAKVDNARTDDACAPLRELADLDPRQPVPLQPRMAWHQKQNMMDHLVVIQQVTAALTREDFDAVAAASARIESTPQMARTCEHMGAGADGFTERALDFHERANAIGQAARARDSAAVLRATADTLAACTGCHATYRQEVVDVATWERSAGVAFDAGAAGAAGH